MKAIPFFIYFTITISTCFLLFSCSTVRLSKFEASECKENCAYGINSFKIIGNNTTIIYGAGSACCLKFKGKVDYKNDTLFLTSIPTTQGCRCMCGYEFRYFIKGLKNENPIIKYNIEYSRKQKKINNKNKKLNELRELNPKKYNKIQYKRRKKEDRIDNRIEAREKRKKLYNLGIYVDDVYK